MRVVDRIWAVMKKKEGLNSKWTIFNWMNTGPFIERMKTQHFEWKKLSVFKFKIAFGQIKGGICGKIVVNGLLSEFFSKIKF